jgi:hypothetical protein
MTRRLRSISSFKPKEHPRGGPDANGENHVERRG